MVPEAVDQKYLKAYSNLGELYGKGRGVEQNYTRAFELYKYASDHEDKDGHFNLAVLYSKGK